MANPWESAPKEHQQENGGAKPWESAPTAHQDSTQLPNGLKAFKLDNGSMTVQRPSDGAVYIKEANDPRFKGQEGWHYQDPQTGVWVPAPATDPAKMGWLQRNLGGDAWKAFGRNLKAGFSNPGNAVLGLGHDLAHVVGLEGDKSYLENINNLEQGQRYNQALANVGGKWAKVAQLQGEAVPMIATMAMTPELAPATMPGVYTAEGAAAATPYISRLAATGLKAMPYAYATTPGDQATRLKAGTIAGLVTPIAQAGVEKVAVPAAKAVVGGIRGLMSPEAAQLTAQAARNDIPLSTGEALGQDSRLGRAVRGVEDSGEPTARWFNNTQEAQDKAGAAAQGLLKQVRRAGKSMGFESEDAFRQALAADPYNKRLQALGRVLDQARSGDPADVAEASANLKNWSTRQEVGKIYDQARAAAADLPKPNSSLKNVTQAGDKITSELGQLPESARGQFKDVTDILDDYNASLQKGGDTTIRKYNSLDAMSNRLGDMARDATDATKARYFRMLQQGVEADMRGLATANPGSKFSKLFQEADRRFATEVVPFEDNAIAKAMRSSTPDEVYGQFMKRGGYTDRGLKFYDALDPKGQQAVKEKFLQDALDAATDRTQPGQPFDPHKFVGYLDQYRGARKVIMNGADGEALSGLENVLKHLKARPNSSAKPSFFSSFTAGGSAVLNTGPVRKLLLAADSLTPGSNKMERLLTSFAGQEAGKLSAQSTQEAQ